MRSCLACPDEHSEIGVGPAIKSSEKSELFLFMEEWFTYILYSDKIDKYYVGNTNNLEWRLERHNLGWGRFTKRGIPWKIVYHEKFDNKSDALKRDREIKNKKSRKYIEYLINHAGGRPANKKRN